MTIREFITRNSIKKQFIPIVINIDKITNIFPKKTGKGGIPEMDKTHNLNLQGLADKDEDKEGLDIPLNEFNKRNTLKL